MQRRGAQVSTNENTGRVEMTTENLSQSDHFIRLFPQKPASRDAESQWKGFSRTTDDMWLLLSRQSIRGILGLWLYTWASGRAEGFREHPGSTHLGGEPVPGG